MNINEEVAEFKLRRFPYAALYLENPEVIDGFRLNDILALNYLNDRLNWDTFTFMGKEIEYKDVPLITVKSANRVRELLPEDKPVSLEDAYLITAIAKDKTRITRVENPLKLGLVNEKYVNPGIACGFFHATYFFTPFLQERKVGEFYATPTRLIQHIAKQEETDENLRFAERIMGRLVKFYNTELRRVHEYYEHIMEKVGRKQMNEEEKIALGRKIGIDLKGYNGEFLRDDVKPEPYPSKNFHYAIQYAGNEWMRPLYGTHLEETPEEILGLARICNTSFAKILAQRFREIVKEDPLEYFDPPYTKKFLEEKLE